MADGEHVFISYARRDRAFAQDIVRRLRRSGIAAWQDLKDLKGGDKWHERIDDALSNATALILVLSPDASRSQYVTYEWTFALGAGVKVIPILRRRTEVHERLQAFQQLDFTSRNPRKPWVRLLKSLPGAAEAPRQGSSPMIQAWFDMTNGRPSRVAGGEYVIWLRVDGVSPLIRKVTFEAHDDSFIEPRWTEQNVDEKFETWMQSYGDVFVTASLHGKGRERTPVGTTLYEALRRTHGESRNAAIMKALREIKDN